MFNETPERNELAKAASGEANPELNFDQLFIEWTSYFGELVRKAKALPREVIDNANSKLTALESNLMALEKAKKKETISTEMEWVLHFGNLIKSVWTFPRKVMAAQEAKQERQPISPEGELLLDLFYPLILLLRNPHLALLSPLYLPPMLALFIANKVTCLELQSRLQRLLQEVSGK